MNTPITSGWAEDDLPDPPENLDFLDLPDELQERYTARFEAGIAANERALFEARQREHRSFRMAQARTEKRKQARAAYLASRFNPVLRSRP